MDDRRWKAEELILHEATRSCTKKERAKRKGKELFVFEKKKEQTIRSGDTRSLRGLPSLLNRPMVAGCLG